MSTEKQMIEAQGIARASLVSGEHTISGEELRELFRIRREYLKLVKPYLRYEWLVGANKKVKPFKLSARKVDKVTNND